MIIALDGPAGSGKSTIAKIVAKKLEISYLDTGAMYRMVTLYCLENKIDVHNQEEVSNHLENINLEIKGRKFFLNNKDVSKDIRSKVVNDNVSYIASIKEVRIFLVDMQRKIGESEDCILDGRDIGTVVFPNADYKFFLNATPEERAKRRFKENSGVSFEEVLNNIKERDHIDSTRKESPLKKAEDAIEIDTTSLNLEEVKEVIINKMGVKWVLQ